MYFCSYKRFIRSKDTSQYSQKDMACIFGNSPSQSAPATPLTQSDVSYVVLYHKPLIISPRLVKVCKHFLMGLYTGVGGLNMGRLIHRPHLTSTNINQVWYLLLIFNVKIYTI